MKIRIHREPWNDELGVLLYSDVNGKRYIVKPVKLEIEEVKEGVSIEPTFKIGRIDRQEFIKSMAEIAEDLGVKTDAQLAQDKKYEGKLEATQYHLEDMRRLVFKEPMTTHITQSNDLSPKIENIRVIHNEDENSIDSK